MAGKMSAHLQLCGQSQGTRGRRERFGRGKGVGCVPFPSVWHFPSLEVKGCSVHERPGWLSTTLQVQPCWGSSFLLQKPHPASAVQEEKALQRAMLGFAAGRHGCRRDEVGCAWDGKELCLSLLSTGCRDETKRKPLNFHRMVVVWQPWACLGEQICGAWEADVPSGKSCPVAPEIAEV